MYLLKYSVEQSKSIDEIINLISKSKLEYYKHHKLK